LHFRTFLKRKIALDGITATEIKPDIENYLSRSMSSSSLMTDFVKENY
jgi:hypothetical protein